MKVVDIFKLFIIVVMIVHCQLVVLPCNGYLLFAEESNKATQSEDIASQIEKYIPDVHEYRVDNQGVRELYGFYSTEKFTSKDSKLCGKELYLFSDNSYCYLFWADISPLEVCDKGVWEYNNGFVELKSDNSIKQTMSMEDTKYVPICCKYNSKEIILLIGTETAFPLFIESTLGKSELDEYFKKLERRIFILDLYSFNKRRNIEKGDYKKIKKMLKDAPHLRAN